MSRKYTHNEVVSRVAKYNPHISVLGEYVNCHTPLLCQCNKCGNRWKISLNNITSGKGCPRCAILKSADQYKKTKSQFEEELNVANLSVKLLGEYTSAKTKTSFLCLVCNHVWDAQPGNILFGYGCPECWRVRRIGIRRKKFGVFVDQMAEKHPHILIKSPYITAKDDVLVECLACGFEWSASPDTLLNKGCGCPNCVASYGEQSISAYLFNHKIQYVQWKRFDDLFGLGGGKLSYDFYLPDYNLLIEYQGEFHDESVDPEFFHNDLGKQRAHDNLKREYAKSHQIQLLEIWYYDFKNIEKILDATLVA